MKIEIELADLHAFVAVMESDGFTVAARRLGTTKSVLSRRVGALERRLGAVLLERAPRGIRATEVGAVYYAKCVRILESVDAASDFVSGFHDMIKGRLRVALGDDAIARWLAPALHDFADAYPQVTLDLVHGERADDGQDPDVVIGPMRGDEDGWVAWELRSCDEILCASPEYLAANGVPASADCLAEHDGLLDASRDTRGGWHLRIDGDVRILRVRERLRSTSAVQLIAAAEAGLGIVLQPDYLVADALAAGRLTAVLPTCTGTSRALAALYLPSRRNSRKVRALLKFLQARLSPNA